MESNLGSSILPSLKAMWSHPARSRYIAQSPKVRLSFLFSMAALREFGANNVGLAVVSLQSMSPAEYQGLYLRAVDLAHPAEPALLMRYLLTPPPGPLPASAPLAPPVEGTQRTAVWSRADVLSCMDDRSGRSPAVPIGWDAVVTTHSLRGSILMMALAKHFLPEFTGAPIGALIGGLTLPYLSAVSPAVGASIGLVIGSFTAKAILFCMSGLSEIRRTEKELKENQKKVVPWRFDPDFVAGRLREVGLNEVGLSAPNPATAPRRAASSSVSTLEPGIQLRNAALLVPPVAIPQKTVESSRPKNVVPIKPKTLV